MKFNCFYTAIKLVSFLLFFSQQAFALGNIVISGKINRDAAIGTFDLVILVPGSANGTTIAGTETEVTQSRLKIYIPKASADEVIPYEGVGTPTANLPYTFVKTADASEVAASNNLKDVTYRVRITYGSAYGTKPLTDLVETDSAGKKYVTIKLKYYEADKLLTDDPKIYNVEVSSAVINAAPTGVALKPTHQEIKLEWTPTSTAKYTDDTDGPVGKIKFVAIAEDSTLTHLPTRVWTPAESQDRDATTDEECTFSFSSTTISCLAEKTYYPDSSAIDSLSSQGVYLESFDSSKGAGSFTKLENGKKYYIFAYYDDPVGLGITSVSSTTPVENKTGAEIAGEPDAKWDTPRCFIATAAYGSPLHKNLGLFTWFRDHVLLNFDWGKTFVDWYYQNGPYAAKIVAQYPVLAFAVRGVLWIPALLIGGWLSIHNYPSAYLWTGFAMMLMSGVFFANYCLRRSRQE